MKIILQTTAIILFNLLTFNVSAQLKESELSDVFQTYGFVKGQEYSLDRIEANHPEYTIDITKCKAEFNSKFKSSVNNLEAELISLIVDEFFDEYKITLNKELDKLLAQQELSSEEMKLFFTEVTNRSKGNLQSPVLEYLLYYKFKEKPHQEFLQDYIQEFLTKDHSKSKGTDVKLKIPLSW